MKTTIIAIGKNEELYLDEWITYHLNLGFDKIFFIDNNESKNREQEKICSKYKNVECIVKYFSNNQLGLQSSLYIEIYNKIKSEYDWIAFLDIDEFINLKGKDIKTFLMQSCFSDASEILINWKNFGDNDLVYYENIPVRVRFTKPYENTQCYSQNFPENEVVKCLLRGNLNILKHEIHTVKIENETKIKNSDGKIIERKWRQPISYDNAFIEHYETKTLDEYIRRKILNKNKMNVANPPDSLKRLNWFFNVNKHSEEKDVLYNFIKSKL